ncbi:MAG: hypothetical protein DME03_22760, partial [Candidatus Rokuibacteriota bacterium]
MPRYDSAVLNGTVVFPFVGAVRCDVGIRDGRIAALADSIASAEADTVIDARDKLVLPGGVDSHFHIGIYRDLATDASSETASALTGGVTTVLSYFRTGQNYLNKSGPYRTIFPEVVAATTGHAYTDFGYHIGVMTTEQREPAAPVERRGGRERCPGTARQSPSRHPSRDDRAPSGAYPRDGRRHRRQGQPA